MKKSCLAFFAIYLFIVNLYSMAEIILKDDEIFLSGEKIYLGDIADFSGVDDKAVEELSNIYIKKASLPGYKTIIPKELVLNKVTKYYGKVKITGPDKVIVIVKKKEIEKNELEKVVLDYINERMPWQKDETEIEFKNISKDTIKLPEGEVLLKVKENFNTNFKGNIIVPVEIYVDNKFFKIEPVSLFIKVTKNCFAAKRNIKSKEKLSETDIEIVKKDITYLPDDLILSESEIYNLVTKKAILKGTLLLKSMFETQPLFRKGSRVAVIVKVKNIMVEAEGTAQEDGRAGDLLRVKLDNGKILEGKVNTEGKIIIEK